MTDFFDRSLIVHEQLRGKIGIHSKVPVKSRDDLSLAYTPGLPLHGCCAASVMIRVCADP
jgi:malic enzyme